MADSQVYIIDPKTKQLIPVKLYDNGDGTYSFGAGSMTLATGTLTTSSATVPADTGRTEATHFWDGCLLLITSGSLKGQVRRITTFTATTGVFTLATTLTAVPGLATYAILASQS